jgi:hypothetical protein
VPRKPNPPPDDEDQAKRFIETAKMLESDKTGKAFTRAIGVVVPSIPQESINKKKSKA